MKCISMIAAVICVAAVSMAGAQEQSKKFSLYANFGYGFAAGDRYIGTSNTYVGTTSAQLSETRDVYLNYGQGIKLEFGAKYRMLQDVDALFGFEFSGKVPRSVVKTMWSLSGGSGVSEYTTKATMFGFKLQAVPRFTVFDLLDVFVGAGFGLFFTSSEHTEISDATPNGTGISYNLVDRTVKEYNWPSLAFIGTMGAEYPVSDMFIITADVNFELMSVVINKTETTDHRNNNSISTEIYENNVTDRAPPYSTPASSVAIRVGVRVPIF